MASLTRRKLILDPQVPWSRQSFTKSIHIVKNEIRWVIDNCSNPMDAEPHLKILTTNLVRCGYPEDFINKQMLIARSAPPKLNHEEDPNTPILCIPFIPGAFNRIVKKINIWSRHIRWVVVKAYPNAKPKMVFPKPPVP